MHIQERVVTFLDYANINWGFEHIGIQPNYADLLAYFGEGRFVVESHVFMPIDPRNPHARDRDIEALWQAGYLVHQKIGAPSGDTYKCDFDVEITLELMRTAELVRPDIIVLASGDKDFVPVVLELRRRGIRVEVAAFAGINAARELMLKASGFIDLEQYVDERTANSMQPATVLENAIDYDDKPNPDAVIAVADDEEYPSTPEDAIVEINPEPEFVATAPTAV